MRILHISADYPDPLQQSKTRAVSGLLTLADGHDHRVWSLNRTGWRDGIHGLGFADGVGAHNRAVGYGAPAWGILHQTRLEKLALWIADQIEREDWRPHAIHAHKLTVEGIVGRVLAERWDVPLLVSVQGNTDLRIAQALPHLRATFRQIWHGAACVFPFAPWAAEALTDLLGPREGAIALLPCPTSADTLIAPVLRAPVIRTAFNLSDAENKNAARLIQAFGIARQDVPNMQLDIAGGGCPRAFSRLAAIAERIAPDHIRLCGPIAHEKMPNWLNHAAGFALVSHRESYGMVFAEALLAGAPCLIPGGRGIDGYLAEGSAVLSADPNSTAEIAAGLIRLCTRQSEFKATLRSLGATGRLAFLQRKAIRTHYLKVLDDLDLLAAGERQRLPERTYGATPASGQFITKGIAGRPAHGHLRSHKALSRNLF